MSLRLEILRREATAARSYWQSFLYDPASEGDTVATALTALGNRKPLLDAEGREAAPIRWEHSCLQKKCGACAMVICGRPRLACDARLTEFQGPILVEPLRKFPVVADLIVDRSVMLENLKTLSLWLEETLGERSVQTERAYEASRCLQCGLCLEVCPNFDPEGAFFGAAGAVPASRLLAEQTRQEAETLIRQYRTHIYAGCGKSLSCSNICPAGIDVEALMVNSNGAALWKRLGRTQSKERV